MTPSELARWERWADAVKPGDRCMVRVRVLPIEATVTAIDEAADVLWAQIDGMEPEPWEWENVGPLATGPVTPPRNTPEWDELVLSADPFAGDFGDPGDRELSDKMVVARKPGPCHICRRTIQPKERVRRKVDVSEGEMMTFRFCSDCCHAFAMENEDGGAASEERARIGMERPAVTPC